MLHCLGEKIAKDTRIRTKLPPSASHALEASHCRFDVERQAGKMRCNLTFNEKIEKNLVNIKTKKLTL